MFACLVDQQVRVLRGYVAYAVQNPLRWGGDNQSKSGNVSVHEAQRTYTAGCDQLLTHYDFLQGGLCLSKCQSFCCCGSGATSSDVSYRSMAHNPYLCMFAL